MRWWLETEWSAGQVRESGRPVRRVEQALGNLPRPRIRWAGVRAPIVAKKGRNGPGAKGAQEGGWEWAIDGDDTGVSACGLNARNPRGQRDWLRTVPLTHMLTTPLRVQGSCASLAGLECDLSDVAPVSDRSILCEVRPPTGEPDAGDPPVRFGGRGIRIQSIPPTPVVQIRTLPKRWAMAIHPNPRATWYIQKRAIITAFASPRPQITVV